MLGLIFGDKVRGAAKDLECRTRNRGGEPLAESNGIEGIIRSPDHGRREVEFAEALGPRGGIALARGTEVRGEGIAAGRGREVPQAGVEGKAASVGILKAASH